MKRLIPLAMLALTLPGCAALTGNPQTISNRTMLDERFGTLIEDSYTAAGMLVVAANALHPFSPELKERVKAADRKVYEAVAAVRAAYAASNAPAYSLAVTQAQIAISALIALVN